MYADRKGWDLGEVRVAVRHFKEGDADRIEREIHFSAPLTDDQRKRLLEVAEKTPVTKTIASGSSIETKIG
jgi:putative redox protein